MSDDVRFNGFPKELVRFYQDLLQNNDRDWFNERKDVYREQVLVPAQDFVRAMGGQLRALAPDIVIDTRTNGAGSIFRIYRDTRFSKDKTPYKTFLSIFFWEGSRKKMENSGFYFHLEPPKLMLAVGMQTFPKPFLEAYRNSVVHPEHGPSLVQAVEQVVAHGRYEVGGSHYKRVPRGYDADHKLADYLRYKGLNASVEDVFPEELHTPDILDYCLERFREMVPIHRWLVAMTKRV